MCNDNFEMSDVQQPKMRICVIGAGPAGLCAARHLAAHSKYFDFVVFERANDVGGTWLYTEKTGKDEYNLPIHSSMYKNVRANVPRVLMTYPDFDNIGGDDGIHCCVSHDVFLKYLQDYANHFRLRPYVKFETIVEKVRPEIVIENDLTTVKWNVKVKNLKHQQTADLKFDAVMVCNGHFSHPFIPDIPGVETLPGKVLHSHSYRKPEDFVGETVVILGAYLSGVDISIDLSRHGIRVFLSHNKDRLTCELPTTVTQVAGVERIDGNQFYLRDGSVITADSFIYCTGYDYSFPFLDESCGVFLEQNNVFPMYKHIVNVNFPTMGFIGLVNTVLPFCAFHMQVQYYLGILMGKISLPSKALMLEDSNPKSLTRRDSHKLDTLQWEYYDTLAKAGGFDSYPTYFQSGYENWKVVRGKYPERSRYYKFIVSNDLQTADVMPRE